MPSTRWSSHEARAFVRQVEVARITLIWRRPAIMIQGKNDETNVGKEVPCTPRGKKTDRLATLVQVGRDSAQGERILTRFRPPQGAERRKG